jgi:hypothetical protein
MRKVILVLALLLVAPSSFGQNNNSGALGGKTGESTTAPVKKKSVPKPVPKQDKPVSSPCGVYYQSRADMSAESNSSDKWLSLGQSVNKQFWYNPHKTTCDAKTGVLKSWIKEVHKNTDGNYAMVLYEFKCKTNQLRVRTVIEYDQAGNVLETNNQNDEAWQEAAPGTAGEFMLRTICHRP